MNQLPPLNKNYKFPDQKDEYEYEYDDDLEDAAGSFHLPNDDPFDHQAAHPEFSDIVQSEDLNETSGQVQDLFSASTQPICNVSQINSPDSSISFLVDSFLDSITRNTQLLNAPAPELSIDLANENPLDDFIFREYQLEIYEKAKGKNSIIFLETGLGKTLIIEMLLWYQITKRPSKKLVFLANTVALVEQQSQAIFKQLPRVAELLGTQKDVILAKTYAKQLRTLHSGKCIDHWNAQMWRMIMETNKIFVMTTQTFLNVLRNGITKLRDYSFIAFDECHAAQADHPYNFIMREFYFPLKRSLEMQGNLEALPQIVGSTASPVINSKSNTYQQILTDLINLSANLDSFYIYANQLEVQQYLNEAKVNFLEYDTLFMEDDLQKFVENNLALNYKFGRNQLTVIEIMRKNNYLPEFFELLNFIQMFKEKHCNNIILHSVLKQLEVNLVTRGLVMYLDIGQITFVQLLELIIYKLRDFLTLHTDFTDRFALVELKTYLECLLIKSQKNYFQSEETIVGLSPKMMKLLEMVQKIYDSSGSNRILVFVKYRIIAVYMHKIIEAFLNQKRLNIASSFIIGQTGPNPGVNKSEFIQVVVDKEDGQLVNRIMDSMDSGPLTSLGEANLRKFLAIKYRVSPSEQNARILKFRTGEIQLLISTSVAEEGLDIPQCNFVFGFNQVSSTKAFVQMKGRARKANSVFYVMIPKKDAKEQIHEKTQEKVAEGIKELIRPERALKFQAALQRIQKNSLENTYFEAIEVQSTGASINTNWSCQLINQFCQSMVFEGSTKSSPKYAIYEILSQNPQTKEYLGFLHLPLPLQCFVYYGTRQKSVKEAKASVAFKAAGHLLKSGYLDGNLRPLLQNEVGYHIGAEEDDSSIEMNQTQMAIARQYTKRVIKFQSFFDVKLNSSTRYYAQLNRKYFEKSYFQQQQKYYRYGASIKQLKVTFLVPQGLLETFESMSDELLKAEIIVDNQTQQQLSNQSLLEYYERYQTQLIQEQNMLQLQANGVKCYKFVIENEGFRKMESLYTFMDAPNSQIFCVKEQTQVKLGDIFTKLLKIFKLKAFQKRLAGIVEQNPNKLQVKVPEQNQNSILKKLSEYFNTLCIIKNQAILKAPGIIDPIKRVQQAKIYQDYLMPLDLLLSSLLTECQDLNMLRKRDQTLGKVYFKLMISLQLYISFNQLDPKLRAIKQRQFLSPTFIRNQLLQNYAFQYLHKDEFVDKIIELFPCTILYDEAMEQSQHAQNKNQQTSPKVLNHTHISNKDFKLFLEATCKFLHDKDEKMRLGFQWLRALGLFEQLDNTVSNTDQFSQFHQSFHEKSEQYLALRKGYQNLEALLKYQFNNFDLLFKAMTDVSFKFQAGNQLSPKFHVKFAGKDELQGVLNESDMDRFIMDIEKLKEIETFNFENTSLAFVGKFIWQYIVYQLIRNLPLDKIQMLVLRKSLTSVQLLAYAVVKLGFVHFLNNGVQRQINAIIDLILSNKNISVCYLVNTLEVTQHTQILANSFLALVAALYFDTQCDMQLTQQILEHQMNLINYQQLCSQDFINRKTRYRFMNWYQEKQFGDPFDFDLVRIPFQDQLKTKQNLQLYIPYDSQKSEIGISLSLKLKLTWFKISSTKLASYTSIRQASRRLGNILDPFLTEFINHKMKQPIAEVLEMEHAVGYSGKISRSVCLHPNGLEYVAIAGASLIVTDIRDPHKQWFLQGHDDQITCLAVSNGGELLASGQRGDNSDVIIWDYNNRAQRYKLSEHDNEVSCVEFSHDDRLLFSSGNAMDRRIFIWDCITGYIVGSVNHCPEPTTLARWGGFAKDIKGRDTARYQFATAGNKQICLWRLDPRSGVFEKEIVNTGNLVRDYICMEFSKNREDYLFLGTTSGDFCAFQMKNKFFSHHIVVAALGVMSIRFLDPVRFIVGTGNGTLAQYKIEENKILLTNKVELGGAINSISCQRDGRESLIATDRGLIYRIQSDTLKQNLHSENHTGPILDLSYPPGISDRFASASEDGTIRIWDISEYRVLARCQANVATVPLCLVYRDEVLISGWADGKIRMFRSDNGQQIWQIDNAHKTGVTTLCVANNLKFFCSGGGEGDVRVWEMRTREMVSHLKEHTHKVTKVQLIARETQLLSASRDRALLQWDLKSEKRISAHIQRMGGINSFDNVPNTGLVFSTGQDRKITQWDLSQNDAQRQFDTSVNPKKGDECYSFCLAHSGRLAATGGSNCTVKLWNLQNGQMISEGVGHSGAINSVKFSPDDKQVISGAQDGVVIVWNVFL